MSKVNLIESHFDLNHPFEAAVLCSYGLDLNFLENYLLALRGLGGCDTIALFVDASTYDAFAERTYVPRLLNRRYLVTPIRTVGVFHTKLYILASPRKAVITIGSANLTREGIAGNLELLTTVEVTEKQLEYAYLLGDALDYLSRLARLSESEQAMSQIDSLAHTCAPLLAPLGQESDMRLIHNLDQPILDTILSEAANLTTTKAYILSPFYDTAMSPLSILQEGLKECPVEFSIQQRKSNFPIERLVPVDPLVTVALYHDIDRYIHGKAIVLEAGEEALVYTGSANFTRSALMSKAQHGNYEIGLIGRVPATATRELIRPPGSIPTIVQSAAEIEVDSRIELPISKTFHYVNYLTEAVQENNNTLRVRVKPDVTSDIFNPRHFRLTNFNGESIEGPYIPNQPIMLDAKGWGRFQSTYAVQLLGLNGRGETVESNRVWVIDLETRSGNSLQRKLRRIYQDPAQLMAILREISVDGNEHEVMLFLSQFDIPLDLILPPVTFGRPRNFQSKGNLVGQLPYHRSEFFSSNMIKAYDDCLRRLVDKMRKHRKHLQRDRIGNFALLYSSALALLTYLNEWGLNRYKNSAFISNDDWLMIRDCYNLLIQYAEETWILVWGKEGYRNAINAKFSLHREDNDDVAVRFETLLLTYFNNSAEQFIEVLKAPLGTFTELYQQVRIRNSHGSLVKPTIFPTNHYFLQSGTLENVRTQYINKTLALFSN